MKILIIPAWYQPAAHGHSGIFVRDVAEEYVRYGHVVSVIYFDDELESEVQGDGFIEFYAKLSGSKSPFFCKLNDNRVLRYFNKWVAINGMPDMINSHGISAIRFAGPISRKYKIPIIHTEHLSRLMKPSLPFAYRIFCKIQYKKVNAIIGVSNELAEKLRSLTSTKVYAIPGMIHRSFFEAKLFDEKESEIKMICVSDLDPRKGHELVLNALAIIKKKGYNFKWYIVGDGPERDHLITKIAANDLSDHVLILGKKSRNDIISIMQKCSIYLTGTRLESFGSHIAEGLAMGLFVVSYDCGSIHTYINEKNGLIVGSDDAQIFADSIEKVINDLHLKTKTEQRDSIRHISSPASVVPKLLEIMQEHYQR